MSEQQVGVAGKDQRRNSSSEMEDRRGRGEEGGDPPGRPPGPEEREQNYLDT